MTDTRFTEATTGEEWFREDAVEAAKADARREALREAKEVARKHAWEPRGEFADECADFIADDIQDLIDAEAPALVTCQDCMGTGISGHPDSGQTCDRCGGDGAEAPATVNSICRICDGGPGNDGVCLCGAQAYEAPTQPKPDAVSDERIIERVAKAIAESQGHDWGQLYPVDKTDFRIDAQAALRALAGGNIYE